MLGGARVRHVSPELSRAAIWLAVLCACVPFLPELVAPGSRLPGGAALTSATRDAASYWLAGAAACLVGAWLASRGITEAVTVRLDARCLYVTTKRIERRTPRWMIEDVFLVPPRRREVWLPLSSGRTYRLVFATAEQARELAAALAPAPGGRSAREARRGDRGGDGRPR